MKHNDDTETRRANLRALAYKPADMSRRLGNVPSLWGDLMREGTTKAFGEKIARRIEAGYGLPRGWLDLTVRAVLVGHNERWSE